MMTLLLSDRSDSVRERERFREVLESELFLEMVLIHDLPLTA